MSLCLLKNKLYNNASLLAICGMLLKITEMNFHSSGGQKLKISITGLNPSAHRTVFLQSLQGRMFSVSSSFQWLPALVLATSLPSLGFVYSNPSLPLHHLLFCVCQISLCLFQRDTCDCTQGPARRIQDYFFISRSLTSSHIQRLFSHIR